MSFVEALKARRVLVVAHRGASAYAPENTMPAFDLACAHGADVLELDVHLSRDGEVVVLHDERVDRTTDGSGEVRGLTLAEIRSLDAGRWFGDAWRGTVIPTLREVLEMYAPRALLDIEVKAGVFADSRSGMVREDSEVSIQATRRVLEEVERAGAVDRVVVSGFGLESLRWVRSTVPRVATQWSVASVDITKDCETAVEAGVTVISPQEYAAGTANVARAHAAGLSVHVYTRGDDAAMAALIGSGVDAVKTGRPDRLRDLMLGRPRFPAARGDT
jgi:glycerophosphoryl diester phosphodiesterase